MQMYDQTHPLLVDSTRFKPLSYDTLIREVLAAEAVTRLIQQDLHINRGAAVQVLFNSQEYGAIMFPGDERPDEFAEVQERHAEIYRKAIRDASYLSYLGANTTLDFDTWSLAATGGAQDSNIAFTVKTEDADTVDLTDNAVGHGFTSTRSGDHVVYVLLDD